MNVLIIDDHRLFADGLKLLIQDMDDDEYQIEQAYHAQRAIDLINSGQQFDLILTDLDMPGISGHDLVKALKDRGIGSYIAVVSASDAPADIYKAYELGAKGYICKSESTFDMKAKLTDVLQGKTCFPEQLWNKLNTEKNATVELDEGQISLGKRPMEVLELLAQGRSNKQIATLLNISETTVKFHVRTLFTTLGVNNRTWCVREANRLGLVEASNI